MMRKSLLLMITALFMTTVNGLKAQNVAPDREGMEMDALDWTKEVVIGWNLGNSLESEHSETSWGNPKTTQAMIHAVSEAGFNAIRLPIRWGDHVTNQQNMTIDPEWKARVKEIVDWCLAEGMFVVINDHHEAWYDRNPFYSKQEENNRKLAAMWTEIATYFQEYGEKLIFAGTNEVTVNWSAPTTEQQAVQNSYNQTFVNAVRATGGKNYYRNLVVQTFACSPYHGLNGFTVPDDVVENRLSVEFHYYDPYAYAGSCEYYYWGEAYKDKGPIVTYDTEQTQANLFDNIRNRWATKGIGVVIGEYGVSNHYTEDDKQTQQENMQYYHKTLVSNARKRGFAAFVWDNNAFNNGPENFGIFKRWQNMAVGNTYFLKGISEGAGVEYQEPTDPIDDPDYGGEGMVFWEGDALMDWGNGLQLTVPASEFVNHTNDLRVVLYYTQDYTDYDQLQIFYGDWSSMATFQVGEASFDGAFIPSQFYSTGTGTAHITPVTFSEQVFETVKIKGIVIQGHGVRLTKVALALPVDNAVTEIPAADIRKDDFYTLDGRKVTNPVPGQLIISNGRKLLWQKK